MILETTSELTFLCLEPGSPSGQEALPTSVFALPPSPCCSSAGSPRPRPACAYCAIFSPVCPIFLLNSHVKKGKEEESKGGKEREKKNRKGWLHTCSIRFWAERDSVSRGQPSNQEVLGLDPCPSIEGTELSFPGSCEVASILSRFFFFCNTSHLSHFPLFSFLHLPQFYSFPTTIWLWLPVYPWWPLFICSFSLYGPLITA